MRKAKQFLFNTLLLTATSMLMRFLAMGFQIYLSQTIGAAGIGLYELLMSAYGLAAALAVSGVRLSTIRLLVERRAGSGECQEDVLSLCLTYSVLLGTGAGLLLRWISGFAASQWLDAPELAVCLRILAFSLPCASVSSCLNGCFSALRRGGKIALIQSLEFAVHMAAVLCCMAVSPPETPAEACRLLAICGLCADIFSVTLAVLLWKKEGSRLVPPELTLAPKLLQIAVPDAVGSWVRSGLVTAKHLLIPKGLRKTGFSAQASLAAYGVIQGMVMPVLTFPHVLLGTVSALLVPEVAEIRAEGQDIRMSAALERLFRFTLLFSFFTACGMLFCGGALGETLYHSGEAANYIRLLAPLTPLMYLDTTVDGVLKGLGLQAVSMRINILDAAVSLLLVWRLIPRTGLQGYMATLYISETMNFLLSYRKLSQCVSLRISLFYGVFAPILAAAAAWFLPMSLMNAQPLGLTAVLSGALYYLLLRLFGCLRKNDLRWLSGLFLPSKKSF